MLVILHPYSPAYVYTDGTADFTIQWPKFVTAAGWSSVWFGRRPDHAEPWVLLGGNGGPVTADPADPAFWDDRVPPRRPRKAWRCGLS